MIEITSDAVEAALRYEGSITLVFASHKRPGGGWQNHEKGQEEFIARRTNLVKRLTPYLHLYGNNRAPFYIKLDDVKIENTKERRSFFVCPAPVADLYDDPKTEIQKRIITICKNVMSYPVFITGPFGCGLFGNETAYVKACFEKYAVNPLVIWVNFNKRK